MVARQGKEGGREGGREGWLTLNSGMKLVMGSSNPNKPLSTQTRVAAAVIGLDWEKRRKM